MLDRLLEGHFILRLLGSAVAGIVVGYPYRSRPGGIRVHVLVTMGAALFCLTAEHLAAQDADALLRVVQGVTSGIGFVGAASVIRKGGTVEGIATAASIWISAAVGSECGLGDPLTAIVVAFVISVIVWGVTRAEIGFRFRRRRRAARPPTQPAPPGASDPQQA